LARLSVLTLVAVTAIAAGAAPAIAAKPKPKPTLELTSVKATGFTGILAAGSQGTLYVLSTEHAGALHCTSKCLLIWKPLVVANSVKSVKEGGGVGGKIGFVKRTSSQKQVTFNGYPIYTYAGDKAATAIKGEAISADGGRWYLVHASAKTNAATPFIPELQTGAATGGFKNTLEVGSSSYSLYLLSNEQGGSIHCTGQCLTAWPPLLVPTATTAVGLGAGVNGTIGFIARSATQKQVTFNSYPVYTFFEDTGPGQSNGQGLASDGGTWYLINPAATTASATPIT
jgi:predicted lipoprotein with Yx(FWY)xxD motif